jgi:hypothetical protein
MVEKEKSEFMAYQLYLKQTEADKKRANLETKKEELKL